MLVFCSWIVLYLRSTVASDGFCHGFLWYCHRTSSFETSRDLVGSIFCPLLLSHCSDSRIYQEETSQRAKEFMLFPSFPGHRWIREVFCLTMSPSALLPPVPCCQPRETKWAPPAQRWTNRCEPPPSQLLRWLLQQRLFACSCRSVLQTRLLPRHQTWQHHPISFYLKSEGEDDGRVKQGLNFRLLSQRAKQQLIVYVFTCKSEQFKSLGGFRDLTDSLCRFLFWCRSTQNWLTSTSFKKLMLS